MKAQLSKWIAVVAVAFVLVACDTSTPYYHYEAAPVEGWEKNDTLVFNVPPIIRPGNYETTLGVRTDGRYPFLSLALVVEQTVYGYRGTNKSQRVVKSRTTKQALCTIADSEGLQQGNGLSLRQHDIQLDMTTTLAPGDSIHYAVRHDMKRSILPGIADVGLKLSRK